MTKMRPYLDYYGSRNIIPVRQDTRDRTKHLRRREALYRSLGMVPSWLAGKSVIEFGPGSGDNALVTASYGPGKLVFVDGNPKSIATINKRVDAGDFGNVECECRESNLLDYHDERRFDLVVCEGVLPGQHDPANYLRHVAEFVAPGGLLVITTVSYASVISEVCRRLVKPVFAKKHDDFDSLVTGLADFFKTDLNSLTGMSRLHEDWVLDQILHPWEAITFTLLEAIDAIDNDFDLQGTQPKFVEDWRWYKSIDGSDSGINTLAREQYDKALAAFLDYRVDPNMTRGVDGQALDDVCRRAFELHLEIWHADDTARLPEFFSMVNEIAALLDGRMDDTAQSFRDYVRGMESLVEGDEKADFGTFRTMFGRGQQYASFIRRS